MLSCFIKVGDLNLYWAFSHSSCRVVVVFFFFFSLIQSYFTYADSSILIWPLE